MEYQIEEYVSANGDAPFSEWLSELKDVIAIAKITARIDRAAHGNFGDWKSLVGTKGVFEMRETHGGGYRIFYSLVGKKIILLLAGSTKKDQKKTIAKAKAYLEDYQERIKP
jgi:putative addiction module killer protein